MTEWLGTAVLALGIVAVTNVDDLLVLTVLVVSSRSGRPLVKDVVVGQFLGFTALVAASVAIALGLLVLDERWVRLLGLVPVVLGLRGLAHAVRRRADAASPVASSWWAVTGVTVANGADNVSVYAPLLRTLDPGRAGLTLAMFYVGLAALVGVAFLLGRHELVATRLGRIQHWLGPLIFIALGVAILTGIL